jgi:hypothetical protein
VSAVAAYSQRRMSSRCSGMAMGTRSSSAALYHYQPWGQMRRRTTVLQGIDSIRRGADGVMTVRHTPWIDTTIAPQGNFGGPFGTISCNINHFSTAGQGCPGCGYGCSPASACSNCTRIWSDRTVYITLSDSGRLGMMQWRDATYPTEGARRPGADREWHLLVRPGRPPRRRRPETCGEHAVVERFAHPTLVASVQECSGCSPWPACPPRAAEARGTVSTIRSVTQKPGGRG